jgi:hypothetical protein
MPKAKCCAIRDASLGVAGGCRRPAKVKFGGACTAEHKQLLEKYEPVKQQAALYVQILEQVKADSTGIWLLKANDNRTVILKTHRDCLVAESEAQLQALEMQLVEKAEAVKKAREDAASSGPARDLEKRKQAVLLASQEEFEPAPKRRRVRKQQVEIVSSDEEQEYGAGGADNDEQYADEIEGGELLGGGLPAAAAGMQQ